MKTTKVALKATFFIIYKMTTEDKQTELAMAMYDTYCDATGGLAYNGDILPSSEELFADESKAKQVNAWRAVAKFSLEDSIPGSLAKLEKIKEYGRNKLSKLLEAANDAFESGDNDEASQLFAQVSVNVGVMDLIDGIIDGSIAE